MASTTDIDTGIYWPAASQIAITVDETATVNVTTSKLRMLNSAGTFTVTLDGQLQTVVMLERTTDPSAITDSGSLYTKDTAGTTHLWYVDSAGTAHQLTPPGGAPTDATYVTMSLNGTLTQERVLTAGSGISIVDGGANSTVTISATGAVSPWTTTGTTVHLVTGTNEVTVGGTATIAKFGVIGDTAAEITSLIRAVASQTSDVFRIETSAPANLMTFSPTGQVSITPISTAAVYEFSYGASNAGSRNVIKVTNPDNTNTASHAQFEAVVGGASGGDPRIAFTVTGVTDQWYIGLRNGDSDSFVISRGSSLAISPRTKWTIEGYQTHDPIASTSGSPTIWKLTGPTHTTLAASTEAVDVDFALNRSVQFSTGGLTNQRAFLIRAPTYGFVAASTLTRAATLAITGGPIAGGNATITQSLALWAEGGGVRFDATKTSVFVLDGVEDEVAIDGRLSYRELSPSTITIDQNDYDPGESTFANRVTYWRLASDAARTVTGIANPFRGRRLFISNVGSFNITLSNEHASSSAANRIITGTGADLVLAPDDTISLIYDNVTQRWRILSAPGV